jgi:hypothetical protein
MNATMCTSTGSWFPAYKDMAQAMASMTGLRGSSQAVLEGSLQLSGSTPLNVNGNGRLAMTRSGLTIRAQQVADTTKKPVFYGICFTST